MRALPVDVLEALAALCRSQGYEGFDARKAIADCDAAGRVVRVVALRPMGAGPSLTLELTYGDDGRWAIAQLWEAVPIGQERRPAATVGRGWKPW